MSLIRCFQSQERLGVHSGGVTRHRGGSSFRFGCVQRRRPLFPQYERIVVNLLDENESNLIPVDKAPGGIGETVEASPGRSRMDLWWWLVACAALPIMMIEWWVYTRRVHL